MSYRTEDFARTIDGVSYPFNADPAKTAATLRRLADAMEKHPGGTLLQSVTVVHKVPVDAFAGTTIIIRIHEPRERP